MGLVARSMLSDMVVRQALPCELTFVRTSWATSYKRNRPDRVVPIVWNTGHRDVIERVLSESRVIVAEHREVPGEIWAWLCGSGDVVHYAFTKEDYRCLGLLGLLMSVTEWERTVYATHDTDGPSGAAVVRNHLRRQGRRMYYDPWRLARCSTPTD